MIDFVSCDNGAIELFAGDECVAVAETAKSIAYYLAEYGIDDAYFSSSMDFADEYGFENAEDAKVLFDAGVKMYQMALAY
jgi:hypothetical protein